MNDELVSHTGDLIQHLLLKVGNSSPSPLFNLYGQCSRTRCVRSGVQLLVFHMGTWGFSLGEAKQRNLYIS